MKIKKGDTVKIISGKDRSKTGKVVRVLVEANKVVVDGMNIKKKHARPKKQGQKGQIVQMSAPISASSVMLICPTCKKPSRLGARIAGGKKVRICKKCKGDVA